MAVISIIGAPGVGKSFLVRQLACLECLPAFFEGEDGIFPKEVLKILNAEQDSKERYEWILERYKKTMTAAKTISDAGVDCYVDGDILTFEAWLDAEIGECSPMVLKEWLNSNKELMADKVIVLVTSDEKIKHTLQTRGRKSEQSDFIVKRALRIQQICRKLADKYEHAILIDRENLDFTEEKVIIALREKIRACL